MRKLLFGEEAIFLMKSQMKGIIEELNKVENVLYISDIEGFIESEILFDTEESLSVKENKGKATIQFFLRAEDDEIWSNEED